MTQSNLARIAVSIAVSVFCTVPLFGQAVFGVGTSQPTCADIGATELTGEIVLTVLSGTTVSSPLAIEYSAPITNNSANEVLLTGTGGLAIIEPAPTFGSDRYTIVIKVPAGGGVGDRIHVRGVRIDLAGHGPSVVSATVKSLTTGGNAVSVGRDTGPVTGDVKGPFSVELGDPLAFVNGGPTNPETFIIIREEFFNAFTDNVGLYGQTVPTQIRLTPFLGVPEGVKITFPATVTSTETGATLTTLSGNPEIVPRNNGTTDVVYAFTSVPESASQLESFRIPVTMQVEPTSGGGAVTFQAAILPIGIAVPDSEFPSTDIPRYLERELPDEADLITGATELAFPFQASQSHVYTGIAVTNPLNYRVKVKFAAYDVNGAVITGEGITNPIELIMPRKGQIAKLATELFGSGFNASTLGTIRATGKTPSLVGFYLLGDESGTRLDGATAGVNPMYGWLWPVVFHQAPAPFNAYELFNPGTEAAKSQLKLFNSSGQVIGEGSLNVAPGGTASRTLEELFTGADLSSFTGGYVRGSSDVPLVATQTFGNARESNVLADQISGQKESYYLAHFASGGGYETEINIVNSDRSVTAVISLTAVGEDGTAFAVSGNPAMISIAPGVQWTRKVADLFPGLGGSLSTGYIKVALQPHWTGPFLSVPQLAGSIRFSSADGYGSAALPLFIPPASEFFFSHVAQAQGFFTGVAMVNPNPDAAQVVLEVFKGDGALVGSYAGSLDAGEKISKLLYQLVPASGGLVGGYIRVHSDLPVVSFSLFGTDNGLSLSAIPPQRSSGELR